MSSRGRVAPLPPPGHSGRAFTVTELTRSIRSALEGTFGTVVVQGEVANYKGVHQSSGNHYFSLKDATSQIDVVLFYDRITPAVREILSNGIALQIEGDLTVFEKQGKYQLRALRVEPVGYGALQARFEALKRKLELEGLFSPDRKRPLPRYPTRIGLVTSRSGAAVEDMIRILQARAPYAQLVLADTRVQGDGASRDIAAALDRMNARGQVEVIIVGRGGGSPQDLWAFNEEAVVRAIVRSRIPVVSAVGHEVDITLADLAADLRAATPTHAAQLVVRDKNEIRDTLRQMSTHARARIVRELRQARAHLRGVETHHAFKWPERRVQEGYQSVDLLRDRLLRALGGWVTKRQSRRDLLAARLRGHAPSRSFARAQDRIESCRRGLVLAWDTGRARRHERVRNQARLLDSFDHHRVLERGYALVWSDGGTALRKRGLDLHPGDPIELQFFDARAGAKVTEVKPMKEKA
jgi:exodeoxyribonuclease VII large subunit